MARGAMHIRLADKVDYQLSFLHGGVKLVGFDVPADPLISTLYFPGLFFLKEKVAKRTGKRLLA